MKTKIDLIKSKKLTRILSGKEQREDRHAMKLAEVQRKMNADPGLEDKSYLFFYKQFYHVKQALKKLKESDVQDVLQQNTGTKIYFMCSDRLCPMPSPISGRKMESVKVKDDKEAAEFMSRKSGLTITVNNL